VKKKNGRARETLNERARSGDVEGKTRRQGKVCWATAISGIAHRDGFYSVISRMKGKRGEFGTRYGLEMGSLVDKGE
jgi:hypothetical protein